jgi:hypothetical protein
MKMDPGKRAQTQNTSEVSSLEWSNGKKFFPFCQTRDFCTFLKSAQNSTSFDTLHAQFRRNFFSTLIRGSGYFFRRIKGQIR